METNYNIKVYDYNCSTWFTVSRLCFMPDEFLAERIADEYAHNSYSGYSRIRICNGRTIIKELNFD